MRSFRDFPDSPLYFCHIPKTGGTTVAEYLTEMLGECGINPRRTMTELVEMPPEEISGFRVWSGHFALFLDGILHEETIKFTLLREPISRTVSCYHGIQRDRTHPLREMVQQQSLLEFVQHEVTRYEVLEAQANYLTLQPGREAELLTPAPGSAPLHVPGPGDAPPERLEGSALYEAAKSALHGFALVAATEYCDVAMAHVARQLGRAAPAAVPSENVDPLRGQLRLSSDERRAIERLTEVDLALYEQARLQSAQLFGERRGALYPVLLPEQIVASVIIDPPPGSTLQSPWPAFTRTPGSKTNHLSLWIGSSAGARDLFEDSFTDEVVQIRSRPLLGQRLYVTLWQRLADGENVEYRYEYEAFPAPEIVTPLPGSTLDGADASFRVAGLPSIPGVRGGIWIGNSPRTWDIAVNWLDGDTVAFWGLPADGRPLFVSLLVDSPDGAFVVDFQYRAEGSAG